MKRIAYIVLGMMLAMSVAVHAQAPERTADAAFWTLNAANFALGAVDVEVTQHCIEAGRCYEGNSLLGNSRARRYAETMGIAGFTMLASYKMKKHRWPWWIGPVAGIGGHTFGVFWSMRY